MASKVKLPNKLRVGIRQYLVDVVPPAKWGENYHGDMTSDPPRIRVRGSTDPMFLIHTFLHEVVHAIVEDRVLTETFKEALQVDGKVAEKLEEDIVEGVTRGLIQVLQDNPDVLRLLNQVVKL